MHYAYVRYIESKMCITFPAKILLNCVVNTHYSYPNCIEKFYVSTKLIHIRQQKRDDDLLKFVYNFGRFACNVAGYIVDTLLTKAKINFISNLYFNILCSFHFTRILLSSVPVTEITGDSDRYVKAGSNVTLTCIVSAYIDAPRFIIWYQDATKILPENYRGVITEEKKFNNSSPISVSV